MLFPVHLAWPAFAFFIGFGIVIIVLDIIFKNKR